MNQVGSTPKDAVRKAIRKHRAVVPAVESLRRAKKAARRLLRHPRVRNARRFAVYLNVGTEMPTAPIIRGLWNLGQQVYTPCVLDCQRPRMRMHAFSSRTVLRPARFGILEPRPRHKRVIEKIDVVIVPLLAVDQNGNRIGSGKGFYDVWIRTHRPRPLCVGLAFDFQLVTEPFEPDPWDEPINLLCTDVGTHHFARRRAVPLHSRIDRSSTTGDLP